MSDESQRNLAVKTVAAVFMPVAVIAVMLRCYVRGFIVRAFGLDDAAMVFAVVSDSQDRNCLKDGELGN